MATRLIHGVFIEDQGEGTDVVFCIHGLGGTSNTWTPLLPAFEGKRVVRIDLPGSARSAFPDTPLSIASYVATVLDVLDALNLEAVHLAAHSMGTIVAQHLAVDHPTRVKTLVLFGPLAAPPEPARQATHARAALARTGEVGMQEIADTIVKVATSQETKVERPITLALIRESIMRQTSEGYARSCEALAGAQAAQIENVHVPALLVTGTEDGVGSPAGVQALAARLDNSKTVILEGCGHWTTFEKPFDCIEALGDFYQQQHANH